MSLIVPEAALQITTTLHEMLQCMDLGTEQACTRFSELFTVDGELHLPFVKARKSISTPLFVNVILPRLQEEVT